MPPQSRRYVKKNGPVSERPPPSGSGPHDRVDHGSQQQLDSSAAHCLLCVFPLVDVTAVPCAHDGLICATCTVKITRHLAAPRCCPFCKTEWPDAVIDTAHLIKPYSEYQPLNGLFPIDSLAARSPLKELADKYNKLLTCHCVKCDDAGISIDFLTLEKLQSHLKRKHQLQFCMPCAQHRKALVGDMQLFTEQELQLHMTRGIAKTESQPGLEPHPVCQFCRVAYFGRDELYTHMEREHYHCHICYKQQNENKRYERSYKDLEIHFRRLHHLCDDPTCLTARFVVFETELGLRGHRLQVHSGNLTQKERRAMGNVQVDLVYRTPGLPPSDAGRAAPAPVSATLPLSDPDEFPSTFSNSSTMSGMGWAGPRSSSHNSLTVDNFPSLQTQQESSSSNAQRLPLRPAKTTIEPCTDPSLMHERNSVLISSMKSLAQNPAAYKQFKLISQQYLNGQATKASDFLSCFMQVFGGLDGTTQTIVEGLISLLPDEQKRQALHLVYRHEVDRQRSNTPSSSSHPVQTSSNAVTGAPPPQWVRPGSRSNSARVTRTHIVNAPAARLPSSSVSVPSTPSISSTTNWAESVNRNPAPAPPQWIPTPSPVYPTNPVSFGRRPPPVANQEQFPTLNPLLDGLRTAPTSSDYCCQVLDDAISTMDPTEIQLPPTVCRRLQFSLSFAKHCLYILKKKFEPEQGIPVSAQQLRRAQNQARNVTISDLDVDLPLNNLGVHVGCITRLQIIFRNIPDLSYGPIRSRVDYILNDMPTNDLYILVDYVISLYRNIESQRPKSELKFGPMNQEQRDCDNGKQSKRNRQRAKKRTLIQFG